MRTAFTIGLLVFVSAVGVSVHAKEAPARAEATLWNGRDKAREVWAMAKEYFDASEQRRAEIRAFLDGLGEITLKDVKKHAKKLLKYAYAAGSRLVKKKGKTFTHGGLTGKLHIAGAKKKKPLFIALHGGGQDVGDGASAMQKWSLAAGTCTVIAPTAPELRGSAWNQPDIEQWVLALIEAAKRTWNCDTNRIYVAGHSMGGYGTWSLGCRHADRFAALAPCQGGLFVTRGSGGMDLAPGHLPNLLNTPIRFFNSTDDKQVSYKSAHAADKILAKMKADGYPYEWIYEEYNDIGHGLPPKGLSPIVKWMMAKKRDPHPKHVVWEPSRPHKRRFAWIGKPEGTGRIEGRIEDTIVTLTGSTSGAVVYAAPELFDLEKPVTVRVGDDEVFHGRVPLRLSVLLHTIAETRDPKQYYCGTIEVAPR